MAEETPRDGSDLPEPEWRGLAACDFCGAPLTHPEQLSGACRSCQKKLAEDRACVWQKGASVPRITPKPYQRKPPSVHNYAKRNGGKQSCAICPILAPESGV
jgi:predicted amidophosphoribosyltransferase